jgi:hypothetical protein
MSKQHLPEQVRKQSEEIQALYLEMGEGEDGKIPGEDPVGTEEETPQAAADTDGGEATPPAVEELETAGQSKKDEGKEDWEQKYKSLQGMYNTEMPKLKTQNQDLQQRLENLESLLAGTGSEESASAPLEVQTGSIVTEEDVKEFGDAIDVMRRVTQEEVQPLIETLNKLQLTLNNLNTEVVPKVNQVYTSQANTTQQAFWDRVEAAIPNWREVNNHPDFATWLYQHDPMTRMLRQDLLEQAQNSADADRVIHIFRAWMGETGYDSGNSENDTAHAGTNAELEAQVSPSRGRGGDVRKEQEKKNWTGADIKAFYKAVADGEYKGRDEERAKIEADLFAAQQEGRVVG